jgi:hypothetical protein
MIATDFAERLLRGEKIVWSGRPARGLLFTGQDWLLIPFSLLWGGFALFWESSVLNAPNAPMIMKLWGVPFVLIGLYFIVGRFLVDAWIRGTTRYAITNKRILILRSGPFSAFVALSLNQLPQTSLSESANGRGTIRFGEQVSPRGGRGISSLAPSLDPTPQFIAIEDARRVFDAIQSTQNGA